MISQVRNNLQSVKYHVFKDDRVISWHYATKQQIINVASLLQKKHKTTEKDYKSLPMRTTTIWLIPFYCVTTDV